MKTTQLLSRSTRSLFRRTTTTLRSSTSTPLTTKPYQRLFTPAVTCTNIITHTHSFSTSSTTCKGLSPDSSEPVAPNTESTSDTSKLQPAGLGDSEYHEIADQYIDTLVLALEELAEDSSKGIEVEYSAGVLTLNHPKGTYVLNKQPPNKQIWLSSPISGPKRFDWVVPESVSMGQKQESEGEAAGETGDDGAVGGGKWLYLRDGTTLSAILKKEVGVDIASEEEGDVTAGREGPGGGGAKLDGD